MANKTANVTSRVSAETKQKAEAILAKLGIPQSVAIDIYYHQIIEHNGIPFPVTLAAVPLARDEMSKKEFDDMLTTGLRQTKSGDEQDVGEIFEELKMGG